jgi:nuclear pore complex protein Nup85
MSRVQQLPTGSEPLQYPSDHYRVLYTVFSLFAVIYSPEEGYRDAPVGDDLMEWLNIHYIEPSTEEGDHLSSLDRPWEDETFWPYLTRYVISGLKNPLLTSL